MERLQSRPRIMRILLDQAEQWLKELGVRTIRPGSGDTLGVSRDDMMALGDTSDEDKNYGAILSALKDATNTKRLMWGGKDDDWLYLDAY